MPQLIQDSIVKRSALLGTVEALEKGALRIAQATQFVYQVDDTRTMAGLLPYERRRGWEVRNIGRQIDAERGLLHEIFCEAFQSDLQEALLPSDMQGLNGIRQTGRGQFRRRGCASRRAWPRDRQLRRVAAAITDG
jgi:hypothetical protein